MSQPLPLWQRISFDRLYIALIRRIGWVGFPVRELSDRVRDIIQEHGIKKVSSALFEIATWEGNRIRLNLRANKVSGGLLGPLTKTTIQMNSFRFRTLAKTRSMIWLRSWNRA